VTLPVEVVKEFKAEEGRRGRRVGPPGKVTPRFRKLAEELVDVILAVTRGEAPLGNARQHDAPGPPPRAGRPAVEVHREPDPAAAEYRVKTIVPSGETLVPAAVPGAGIDVAALFR